LSPPEFIEIMLFFGINILAQVTKESTTRLHQAKSNKQTGLIYILIDLKADTEQKLKTKFTFQNEFTRCKLRITSFTIYF